MAQHSGPGAQLAKHTRSGTAAGMAKLTSLPELGVQPADGNASVVYQTMHDDTQQENVAVRRDTRDYFG